MTAATTSVFTLPPRHAAKSEPALIAGDEAHFVALAADLDRQVVDAEARLTSLRHSPGQHSTAALDRDLEIHRLSQRLSVLRRFGLDACLGRMVPEGGAAPIYVGRLGLVSDAGDQLLVDWRSPAAKPFFGATGARPMGLLSRRRYRWSDGRITDYWDEIFDLAELEERRRLRSGAGLDDQSSFFAGLDASRSTRMRDVVSTIQADQDAIIRAGARGALVVEGGPGTGKTVVALHRAAYLLHSDPRIARDGVLFVGPHENFVSYVGDVLPSLGEDSVQICTLSDLVDEGSEAGREPDPRVASLKASSMLVDAVERAVGFYELPPRECLVVDLPWNDVTVGAAAWAEAFNAVDPGTSHNDAREQIWDELVEIIADSVDDPEVSVEMVRAELRYETDLAVALGRAWPLLDPAGLVASLLSKPEVLARSAPELTDAEVLSLQRADARSWTTADLPLLDAARQRIGDPEAAQRRRRRAIALAAQQERMNRVVDDLIDADEGEGLVTMLRGADAQRTLVDEDALPRADPDLLSGPFGHVVVDEAQDLSDAEWQMLLRRCPSRSFTIVGDRAQDRRGFAGNWLHRLEAAGLRDVRSNLLTVNYRTPEEVMAEAEPIIREAVPDASVPTSIRRSGVPVRYGRPADVDGILSEWLSAHSEGTACVIGGSVMDRSPRVFSMSPERAKGLEFDLVVVVRPEAFAEGVRGAVDRYVAMTRATRELVILTEE